MAQPLPASGRLAVSESACPLCQRPLGLRPRVALGDGTQVHEKCHRAVAAPAEAAMSGMMQDLHHPGDLPYCSFSGSDIAALEPPAPHDDAASFQGAGVLDGPGDGEDDVDVVEKASTASTTFMAADGFDGSADECVFKMDDQGVRGGGECEVEDLTKQHGHGSPAARHVAPAAESESTAPAAPPPWTPSEKGRSAEGGASGSLGDGIHAASHLSRQHADKRPRENSVATSTTSTLAASADGALPGGLSVCMCVPLWRALVVGRH